MKENGEIRKEKEIGEDGWKGGRKGNGKRRREMRKKMMKEEYGGRREFLIVILPWSVSNPLSSSGCE